MKLLLDVDLVGWTRFLCPRGGDHSGWWRGHGRGAHPTVSSGSDRRSATSNPPVYSRMACSAAPVSALGHIRATLIAA